MLYLITYELRGKAHDDYNNLYEAIKKCGTSWWHYLDSTWIVKSNLTKETIHDNLIVVMNSSDYLLIVDITNRSYWGSLPKEAWNWIQQNIDE